MRLDDTGDRFVAAPSDAARGRLNWSGRRIRAHGGDIAFAAALDLGKGINLKHDAFTLTVIVIVGLVCGCGCGCECAVVNSCYYSMLLLLLLLLCRSMICTVSS